ncbi:flagellar hook-basal body complex protein [Ligilactobacillus sp. WILCCON 0076]|uniref:Flagellar hook protein FlgE n=1 Tax=Ligilactobacillus ubinensis TaxID=2876789 RepID=A0A9X2JL62_9LACO|nr:flagellar hook-basal body complex protein [Ligilactobacillus ubinensis]MCP0886245.1 flagellar hook-basal body complex protein [Ligilactobacillus ubinensis]
MLRSLFSGVSGMKNLQTDLDVVANNIANVNTTGFKSSRVHFADTFSQTISSASAPTNGNGGTNAKQVGLGDEIASIDTNMTAGSTQSTGISTDFSITGNGFFIAKDASTGESYYTRDGAFERDSEGNLVNSDGYLIQGVNTTASPMLYSDYTDSSLTTPTSVSDTSGITIPSTITYNGQSYTFNSFSVDSSGVVTGQYQNSTDTDADSQKFVLGKFSLATFNNASGLEKQGSNLYSASNNSGTAIIGDVGDNGAGTIESGSLEMSNVDLSTEFTNMIIANRAYQANARVITTSDDILEELVNLKKS